MSKKSKPLFMPRDPKAYWTFTGSKLLMIIVFLVYFCFITVWTFYTMQYYKEKINDLNMKNPYGTFKSTSETIQYILSGREIQKLQTHRHFFLFTGLFLLSSALIALYGIINELVSLLVGFILMQALSMIFEYVGAVKSNDETVMNFKLSSLVLQPMLMILSAIYAFMIRRMEQKAASEPAYRQTIIGVVPNVENIIANTKKNQMEARRYQMGAGHVNIGLNLDDERELR